MESNVLRGARPWNQKCLLNKAVMAIALLVTVIWQPQLFVANAVASTASLADLTLSGWNRDTRLNELQIDEYQTQTGSIALDLLAFPETSESAKAWSVAFIHTMLKPDQDAGMKLSILDEDEMKAGSSTGAMNTSESGLDMSTHTVFVARPHEGNLILRVRSMIREGQPVQVSLLTLPGGDASDEEKVQASKIAYEARLPINPSAAALPLDSMVQVMTGALIYPDSSKTANSPEEVKSSKTDEPKQVAKTSAPDKSSRIEAIASKNGKAPQLRTMPGPRVELSRGKMLESVPDGYRMEVSSRNRWTNDSMTETRTLYLKLNKEGQFEKGHFAVMGGSGGVTAVITEGDKHGSIGSVTGDSNPGGAGTQSMSLTKREGLDPAKYGVYYISGNSIELRHANGEVVTHQFSTDGYYLFELDGKRYFSDAPDGWERKDGDKNTLYRSIDGSYLAQVYPMTKPIENKEKLMTTWLEKMKEKGEIVSATPLKFGKAGINEYVRTVATYKSGSKKDIFLRDGSDSRHIVFTRYEGAKGFDAEIDFVRYVY